MGTVPPRKKRRLSPLRETVPTTLGNNVDNLDTTVTNGHFANIASWNLEQDYENRPRKQSKKEKESKRLPIKTAEGRVEPLQVLDENEDVDSWLGSDGEANGQNANGTPESVVEEPKVSQRQQILDAKEELARVAMLISEDPEEHSGGFKTLAEIATSRNVTVKKLALATQLAVYNDAIPGYRIRPPSELEQSEKLSKEVRRLRSFEHSLVSSYQGYVKELGKYAKAHTKLNVTSEEARGLATLAINCACALLLAVPHFNFRGDLLKILVDRLSRRKIDENSRKCRETLEQLFREDEDGKASLDAVTLLTKMIKARDYQVDESVLNTFLYLRLLSEFSSKGSRDGIDRAAADEDETTSKGKKPKFKKEFRTKKHRKLLKEQKAVEKDFKEADAIVSHEERERMQAETLKLVFVTYFRILKARSPNLMGAVLEGLAKYAHLINQDFFGDLLEALRELTTQAEEAAEIALSSDPTATSAEFKTNEEEKAEAAEEAEDALFRRDATREALLCIITAFALLEGQDMRKAASTLHLDLSFFTSYLYRTLHALAMNPDLELSSKSLRLPDPHQISSSSSSSSSTSPSSAAAGGVPTAAPTATRVNVRTTSALLLRALSSVLLPTSSSQPASSIPPIRVAAFTKQLLTCALHLPEKSTLATMEVLGRVGKLHGRKIAGLWDTEERKGDGVYDALSGRIEASNVFASNVWEGELLRLHFVPGIREGYGAVERAVMGRK
ncbi:hypothetical protein MMC25_001999 [Agyrium rufum]|nr:hypothetical protein [Agyrium rufum]